MSSSLEALVQKTKLVICVGSGGVGKTTTAASIGLKAAMDGRKVLVLTIDPARRLANSLGLQRFGNDEARIALPEEKGELWAMMLDTKSTFDNVIGRVSPDEATRDRILQNNIYRNIADSFAANQEYMATEQLYDVVVSGRYDLVVLDTPPVKNALDFLESPGRFARFLDRTVMKWFLAPYEEGRVFGKLLMGTSAVVFRLLGYIFGREFLTDLSEFFLAFRDLYDGFRERQETVQALFHDREKTTFLVVCAPSEPSVEVAEFFLDELRKRRMPQGGIVINRVHAAKFDDLDPDAILGADARRLSEGLSPHTAGTVLARLKMAHARLRRVSEHDQVYVKRVMAQAPAGALVQVVPRLREQVHDLASLRELGLHLFGRAE